MELNINSTVALNNGINIPLIGLGTWTLSGRSAYQAIIWATEIGYRLIDTATIYGNEREIGSALKDISVPRDELFITTKVWNTDQGFEKTQAAFEKSLKRLKLDYIDLYLIHWPISGTRNETWNALEKLYNDGIVRAIGVSNYTINHLEELFIEASIVPTVNQIEFSPFLYQKKLMEYCKSKNIVVEAYSPLTRARRLNNDRIKTISQKYSKTPAQILIRWGLQHGIIEIPKSGDQTHLKENVEIFDFNINIDDMISIDNLNEDFRIVDDPHLID